MQRDGRHARAHLAYQQQDSAQTLAQGLEEYYASNVGIVTRPDELPPGSAPLFRSHDICHVIFGLNTSLAEEALVDTRTLLSCDVGVRRYLRYLRANAQAQALFNQIGYLRSAWATFLALPRILQSLTASFAMPKKWPWEPPASSLERPLAELRGEFGIRVIRP